MDMLTPLYGEASVPVTPEDSQIYLVVVFAPDFFGSYQNYPYQVKITEGNYDSTTPPTTISTQLYHAKTIGKLRNARKTRDKESITRI